MASHGRDMAGNCCRDTPSLFFFFDLPFSFRHRRGMAAWIDADRFATPVTPIYSSDTRRRCPECDGPACQGGG